MNRDVQDTLLALLGATVLAIGITDVHLRYVKPSMQPLLIAAGAILLLVGLWDASRDRAEGTPATAADAATDEDSAGAHVHHADHAPRSAWLLLLPVLVLSLVTPAALGSFSADRAPSRPPARVAAYPELPADRDGAVDLSLASYTARVAYDEQSLEDRRIRLSGFVSRQGDTWSVTRIGLSCRAADGVPVRVRVVGGAGAPPVDSWVEVTGTAAPLQSDGDGSTTAGVVADDVRSIPAPANPYQ